VSWGTVLLLVVVAAIYFVIVIGWGRVLRHDLADDRPVEKPE
jgi:hypothetical protein